MKKAMNLQHVTVGNKGRRVTYFDVYEQRADGALVKVSTSFVQGWLKTGWGCLRKLAKAQEELCW